MTLESKFLDYDFDEEKSAFGEPEHPTEPPKHLTVVSRVGAALTGVGLLVLIVQLLSGLVSVSNSEAPDWTSWWSSRRYDFAAPDLGVLSLGTWTGLLGSLGFIALGGLLHYISTYRVRTPGIHNDANFFAGSRSRGWITWVLAILISTFYIYLYFYDDLNVFLGVERQWMAPLVELVRPLATFIYGAEALATADPATSAEKIWSDTGYDNRWFLYGTLYTLSMFVFGVRFMFRYRHNRYQLLRTTVLIVIQIGFGYLIPYVLKAFNNPEYYFTYFWPLKPSYLHPSALFGSYYEKARWLIYFSMGMTFLATPFLTYFYGKRWYCSWVCGCGGLAETVGDQWRHMSVKKDWAWKLERWMIHGVLVAIIVGTACLFVTGIDANGNLDQDGALYAVSKPFDRWYGFFIVSAFSGLAGVGFYPLLGARIWCRFGCPMAAILGLFQRTASRFRISTNGGQCMSCGNCSTYCEMGIDVRAYAQRGENIVRASCVGCGICSAACPRGVLKLENGPNDENRYIGASKNPVTNFIKGITEGPEKNGDYTGWLKENDTVTTSTTASSTAKEDA